MKTIISPIFVGIDVSKEFLDVHLYPLEKNIRITNNKEGVAKLIRTLKQHTIDQVVCEATGGYERLVYKQLKKSNYRFWVVQPKRIRAFITSEGIKAKTDEIDAKMIALFASQKRPSYQRVDPSQDEEKLSALVKHRTDLVKGMTRENNKLEHETHCKKLIDKHIAFMEKQLKEVEEEINELVGDNKKLKSKVRIIESVPGVGKVTAHTLMAEVPELGKVEKKQIAAIVGVAPFIRQSGQSKGSATISGGRKAARNTLYGSPGKHKI